MYLPPQFTAKDNDLQARPQAVVTFMGPQAYMSPSVYPDLARVPTWNDLTLHCTVRARLQVLGMLEQPGAGC